MVRGSVEPQCDACCSCYNAGLRGLPYMAQGISSQFLYCPASGPCFRRRVTLDWAKLSGGALA